MEDPTQEVDRLSDLPDPLVASIVSKLPFKEGARMRILGKRYGRIWPCSPNIDLDEADFTLDSKVLCLRLQARNSLADGIKRTGRVAFVNHVRRFIASYQEPKINSFRLHFSYPQEYAAEIVEWIKFAVERDVEELEVDYSDICDPFDFSVGDINPNVYERCRCLRVLKLSSCRFRLSRLGVFDHVKKISFEKVCLGPRSLELLMLSCRCLEELKLVNSSLVGDVRILDVNGLLTRLTIKNCNSCKMEVTVEAPNLKQFEYSGALKEFELRELENLEDVELNFGIEWLFLPDGDVICDEILRPAASARTLTVCSFTLQVIDTGTNPSHLEEPIDRLKHLKLKKIAMHGYELRGIAFLLRSYTQLETLTIEMGNLHVLEYDDFADERFLDELEFWESARLQPFQCLESHLKRVTIIDFKGEQNQVQFLQFLLGKSAVLQEMSIDISKVTSLVNIERYIKAAQELRSLYKASPFVQIVIS